MNNEEENIALRRKLRRMTSACEALSKALIKSRENEKELKAVIKELVPFSVKAAIEDKEGKTK